MPTVGSLFSGIGGLDLGLERAGWAVRWQVENDPYAVRVLAKHWPAVARFEDVRQLDGNELERVDLIAGGFPCQDVSDAGDRAGIDGARSGLWREFARLVRVVRPRLVLVENVPGLLTRGMGTVLGDLAESGFDAEWDCLPAAQFGAPHYRLRVYLVAYPSGLYGESAGRGQEQPDGSPTAGSPAYPSGEHRQARVFGASGTGAAVPRPCWGADQSGVARSAYGVPHVVDRYRGLGNAVVPAVAEWLGVRLLAALAAPERPRLQAVEREA